MMPAPNSPDADGTGLTSADLKAIAARVDALPEHCRYRMDVERVDGGEWAWAVPGDMEAAPMFQFCRFGRRVALAVRWIDGSMLATVAFRTMEAAADLMASGVFAAACAVAGVDVPEETTAKPH